MSFGKNPHVAKAQAAEQKAQLARDESARTLAWREAARLWDRAAERENMEARKQDYTARAEAARAAADGDVPTPTPTDAADEDTVEVTLTADASEAEGPASEAGKTPSRWLN